MILQTAAKLWNKNSVDLFNRISLFQRCCFSQDLEKNYNDEQKEKILKVMNNCEPNDLSGYNITKTRIKKFSQWKSSNGHVKTMADVKLIDGFTEKTAKKLFDSILEGPKEASKAIVKIKGQVLYPHLKEDVIRECKTVLSVHVTVGSICWTLIDRHSYEVKKWEYFPIEYPESKRFQITDILEIAWKVSESMPCADIYVMKAEATTLRASGSDPNNPKILAINLQKAQMISMIVALINARSYNRSDDKSEENFDHKVYFLRSTLPYRLYGTLIGNERVSTDQIVEMLLQKTSDTPTDNRKMTMSESLKTKFFSQKDLQKDMLGNCLFLALTFMDICIYKNQDSIRKLANRGN